MQLIKIMFRFCFSTFFNIFFLWLSRSITPIYVICLFIGPFYLFATSLDALHLLHSTQIRHYSNSKLQGSFKTLESPPEYVFDVYLGNTIHILLGGNGR